MHWQDLVLTGSSAIFIAALVPTLRGPSKPPVSTCLANAGMLLIIAGTVLTLGLWLNAIANIVTALTWAAIGWQSLRREHAPRIYRGEPAPPGPDMHDHRLLVDVIRSGGPDIGER